MWWRGRQMTVCLLEGRLGNQFQYGKKKLHLIKDCPEKQNIRKKSEYKISRIKTL